MESGGREHHTQIVDRAGAVGLLAALIARARNGELTADDIVRIGRALERAGIPLESPRPEVVTQLKRLVAYFLRLLWNRDLEPEEWRVVDELPRLR